MDSCGTAHRRRFGLVLLAAAAAALVVLVPSALGFAVNSTADAGFNGAVACVNGSIVNCNMYASKTDVFLSGSPSNSDAGTYFFAVLAPGGQPNPNDGASGNLSTSDTYLDRSFSIDSNGVITNLGNHPQDLTNGDLQVAPFADTPNPGGVYILAICGYDPANPATIPVDPKSCKYDAFKVFPSTEPPPPPNQVESCFSGTKYRDDNKNGQLDGGEVGLQGWTITIDPTPGSNPGDDSTVTTDSDGNWSWCETAHDLADGTTTYTISETLQNGWRQTGNTVDQSIALGGASVTLNLDKTYSVTVPNNADASADGLNFGNIPQGIVYGAKYYDANHDGILNLSGTGPFTAVETLLLGWPISQTGDASASLTTGASATDANGYPDNFSATALDPGTYTFAEVQSTTTGWVQTGNTTKQGTTTGGASVTLNGDKTYTVVIPNDQPSSASGIYFGNVCTVNNSNGFTLGFWSNSNGQAILKNHAAAFATAINSTYWLVNATGGHFTVSGSFTTEYNAFRTWLLGANSTNASYMLSAQLITTAFDRAFQGLANYLVQDPVTFGGFTAGQWITIDQLLAVAGNATNGFTKTYPNTTASGTPRNNAVAYQTLFNAINNNQATVTPPDPSGCPTPTFP
jgi:hypothetical protein